MALWMKSSNANQTASNILTRLSGRLSPIFLTLIAASAFAAETIFDNPINQGDAITLIQSVVAQAQPFALALAAFSILCTGAYYAIAVGFGMQGSVATAKKLLIDAIIGSVIVAGGVVILNAVITFIQGFK